MDAGWSDRYPDTKRLRDEVWAMVESVVEVLRARIAPEDLAGIYWKGSASKHWHTPVDYVPEISDLDIHVLFTDDAAADRWPWDIDEALTVQADIEAAYSQRISRPIHTPRPQFVVLNELLAEHDYSPSPQHTVHTLYGQEYSEAQYDERREREIAAQQLRFEGPLLKRLTRSVTDKPGKYTRLALSELVWRVSPAGPRALVLLGVPAAHAWSLTRSSVMAALHALGQAELAEPYGRVYLASWDYFLSGYTDSAAAREAVLAAHEVLARGAALAQ